MRFARLASLLAVLALAGAAHAAAGPAAPSGLHGFLLRADEPPTTDFHRTPSFAWSPVPQAVAYQFQLSTSSTFRDNGILFDDSKLLTPVAAPPLTLPWITGSPHALYARVRAIMADGATPWSRPYGFDVTPPPPPTPLPSYPGLLRWTPIEGAGVYEVWLVDADSKVVTRTNVLDEREFYTFHPSLKFMGTVRWRIRVVRNDIFNYRINGIPVTQYGPWSPIYSSSNPAMTGGPLKLVGTVSDVFSNGSANSPAHELMPAFMWTGNQAGNGTPAEFFRVYVFTDKQCLNRVYTSSVIGSPAFAPRLTGPLALPESDSAISAARSEYLLGGGSDANSFTYDGDSLTSAINEQMASPTPTTTVPGAVPQAPGTIPPLDPTGSSSSSSSSGSSSSSSSSSGGTSTIFVKGDVGPPVDLWDTNWPSSGYYWTVVPVAALGLGNSGTTVAAPGIAVTGTALPVVSTAGFHVGDSILIGTGATADSEKVSGIGAGVLTLSGGVVNAHGAGEPVVRAGGSIVYQDMELPQDVCAAGRVQRLGISSEPTLTTGQEPFATGLSATGRLTSAARTPAFYGQPLVAWTPALNADVYEVQWSKKRYPFTAEADPRTNGKGFLTWSTSAVLPLTPGTWYYRVRGIDFNLPTGVQQMAWSDPEQLVVTSPTFKISKPAKKKFKVVGKKK
jgi:hypothetical protein